MTPDHQSPFCGVDEATMSAMTRSLAVLRSVKADSAIYKIDEHVYLGSLGVALNEELLLNSGITHIICVARGIKPYYADRFTYLTIDLLDSVNESLVDRLPHALGFIHQVLGNSGADNISPKRILIHCFAGRSRSVAIILAYLMIFHSLSLKSAFHHVRSIRSSANPNSHFMYTLKALELELNAAEFRFSSTMDLSEFLETLVAVIPGVKTRVRLLQHSATPAASPAQPPVSATLLPAASLAPKDAGQTPDAFISWENASSVAASHDTGPGNLSWSVLVLATALAAVVLSFVVGRLERLVFLV